MLAYRGVPWSAANYREVPIRDRGPSVARVPALSTRATTVHGLSRLTSSTTSLTPGSAPVSMYIDTGRQRPRRHIVRVVNARHDSRPIRIAIRKDHEPFVAVDIVSRRVEAGCAQAVRGIARISAIAEQSPHTSRAWHRSGSAMIVTRLSESSCPASACHYRQNGEGIPFFISAQNRGQLDVRGIDIQCFCNLWSQVLEIQLHGKALS